MSTFEKRHTPYALCCPASPAASLEAGVISASIVEALRSHLQSATFNSARLSALADLNSFYEIASKENWDGEGAFAVNSMALSNAQLFISLMPSNWTKPEVNADPDGELAVEWESGTRRRFSVSIGSDSVISYAWLNGSERGHATDIFTNEIPAGVAMQVSRVVQG